MVKQIILASQSPRRKQLLEQAEITFTIKTAHANEDYPADMKAEEVPLFIAKNKAAAVFDSLTKEEQANSIVLAADTVVVLGERIIGKPLDEADAMAILRDLSGQVHQVITGVLICAEHRTEEISVTTEVHFLPLTEDQIKHYIQTYQPFDKAGAYAIQEWIGLRGIEKINGDFYNVMGLPISKVAQALDTMQS